MARRKVVHSGKGGPVRCPDTDFSMAPGDAARGLPARASTVILEALQNGTLVDFVEAKPVVDDVVEKAVLDEPLNTGPAADANTAPEVGGKKPKK